MRLVPRHFWAAKEHTPESDGEPDLLLHRQTSFWEDKANSKGRRRHHLGVSDPVTPTAEFSDSGTVKTSPPTQRDMAVVPTPTPRPRIRKQQQCLFKTQQLGI